ncbi:hypothetical protein CHU95_00415 [Niveispirillum lacus]|uniref:HTH cro/C1-type domain-containing protein n=2 Tax=Niveispirillum lacus TaxID=1981099 RepID=A0A255Z8N5_9PROT|nr:hypothetical protein CHU95_00415 [Niveispirillum lacus]
MGKTPTSPWGLRAHASGLHQKDLARLAGTDPINVSRGLRGDWTSGVPKHLQALIIAWELMTPAQREDWMRQVVAIVPE